MRLFMMLLGLKTVTRRGGIGTSRPVLGLRPTRKPLSRTMNEPKDDSFTVSPDTIASEISASTISTMAADYGAPGMSLYGSSKAALNLLTKTWAAEYGPSGVRVNAVSPGPTRTEGTDAMGEGLEQLAAQAPAGRPATADEIAEAIVFLATDRASFIHGATLAVDGGRTAV